MRCWAVKRPLIADNGLICLRCSETSVHVLLAWNSSSESSSSPPANSLRADCLLPAWHLIAEGDQRFGTKVKPDFKCQQPIEWRILADFQMFSNSSERPCPYSHSRHRAIRSGGVCWKQLQLELRLRRLSRTAIVHCCRRESFTRSRTAPHFSAVITRRTNQTLPNDCKVVKTKIWLHVLIHMHKSHTRAHYGNVTCAHTYKLINTCWLRGDWREFSSAKQMRLTNSLCVCVWVLHHLDSNCKPTV